MTHPFLLRVRRIDWHRYDWFLFPILIFVVVRSALIAGGYLALDAILHTKDIAYLKIVPNNLFIDMWSRFDAEWYLSIVNHGYWLHPGESTNSVFFPIYPLLVRALTFLTGSAPLAGILISHACLLGGLIFLYRLTEFEFEDRNTARRAVVYISIFPTAFFFGAIYTESAFLLFSVGAVYFARRQLWTWAALMGLIAVVTRVTGILIWGVVLLEWMRIQGWTLSEIYNRDAWISLFRGIRSNWLSLFFICLIPLSLLSLMVFFQIQFGSPLIFIQGQAQWGRQAVGVLTSVVSDVQAVLSQNYTQGTPLWYIVTDLSCLLIFAALVPFVWRRVGQSYALYVLLSVLLAAMNSTFSMSRFVLVLFPAFMLLAHWGRNELFNLCLTVVCVILLGIAFSMFANWTFVA